MSPLPRPAPIGIDDYLDGETRCEIKHECLAAGHDRDLGCQRRVA